MPEPAETRRQNILHWLRKQRTLSIDDLVERLGVSLMTVHRDLDALTEEGQVQKSYGKVTLVEQRPEVASSTRCALCRGEVHDRSAFTVQLNNHVQLDACCPHCGLLLLAEQTNVKSALTRDFIYGRMVNVMQAYYVVNSRVSLCCMPSVLSFTTAEDAASFSQGFGGSVMDFAQVSQHLSRQHQHHGHQD